MLLLEAGRPAPDSPYGHVSMIFVHPDCWGRGIGSALLDAARTEAVLRSWRSLSLWTRESNAQAEGFTKTAASALPAKCPLFPTARR